MFLYLIIIGSFYSVLIISFAYFFKLSISKTTSAKCLHNIQNIKLSVVVAARNEAHQIHFLLDSIQKQTYDRNLFEVIISDDSSTDNTSEVVQHFINNNPVLNIKLLRIIADINKPTYKKYALNQAINIVQGDLIITTDADCVFGQDWLTTIANHYSLNKTKLIIGMIAFRNDNTVFQKMQHLEFLSLIASGIASLRMGYPTMCNAANLIFEKKVFFELNGYQSDSNVVSGDDILFMLKVKNKFGVSGISYITDKESIVYTSACKTLNDFVNQRIRWASKSKVYRDFHILFVAAIVFFYNAALGVMFISAFFSVFYLKIALLLLSLKIIVDFPILYVITTYLNRKDLLKYFIPLQILYFPYILIIGILSFFMPYKWKGRTIKI